MKEGDKPDQAFENSERPDPGISTRASVSRLDGNDPTQPKRSIFTTPVKLILIGVMVFLGSIGYFRSAYFEHAGNLEEVQGNLDELPKPETRQKFPDLDLIPDKGGKAQKLSEYKGKVVLLSFWASWCTPCLVELPTFSELYQKLGDKGLVIVPINMDEPDVAAEFVGKFWETKKFPFPTYFDPNKSAASIYEVDSLPSNFVLDKEGRVAARGMGANDWSSQDSVNLIQALISETL